MKQKANKDSGRKQNGDGNRNLPQNRVILPIGERVRGRPRGQNRIPLTREEQRELNKLYEQMRRDDLAKKWEELGEVMGSSAPQHELISHAASEVLRLRRREQRVEGLRSRNEALKAQLAALFLWARAAAEEAAQVLSAEAAEEQEVVEEVAEVDMEVAGEEVVGHVEERESSSNDCIDPYLLLADCDSQAQGALVLSPEDIDICELLLRMGQGYAVDVPPMEVEDIECLLLSEVEEVANLTSQITVEPPAQSRAEGLGAAPSIDTTQMSSRPGSSNASTVPLGTLNEDEMAQLDEFNKVLELYTSNT